MDTVCFSQEDRNLIENFTFELKRLNNRMAEEESLMPLVMTTQQAAILLGCSRQTVSRKIREGKLHKVERCGMIGILYSEIKALRTP